MKLVGAATALAMSLSCLAQECGPPEPLGDSLWTYALAVSADGSVIAGYGGPNRHALRWAADGELTDLGFDGPPTAISADGSAIVGFVWLSGVGSRVFRWTIAGGMQDLGTLGGAESWPNSISANGSIIVGSSQDAQGLWRIFRWEVGRGMQDILGFALSEFYGPVGSGDGNSFAVSGRTTSGWNMYRWSAESGLQDLGTLDGRPLYVCGISFDGSVVVGNSTWNGGSSSFRWEMSTGLRELPVPDSFLSTWVDGVSANGVYVVGRAVSAAGRQMLVRWSQRDGIELLGEPGPMVEVIGISADGSAIAGNHRGHEDERYAWRWTAAGGMRDLELPERMDWTMPVSALSANGRVVVGVTSHAQGEIATIWRGPVADFNADTFIDFFDLQSFIDCFEGFGCPPQSSADLNGDGFLDFMDVSTFLEAFETGC